MRATSSGRYCRGSYAALVLRVVLPLHCGIAHGFRGEARSTCLTGHALVGGLARGRGRSLAASVRDYWRPWRFWSPPRRTRLALRSGSSDLGCRQALERRAVSASTGGFELGRLGLDLAWRLRWRLASTSPSSSRDSIAKATCLQSSADGFREIVQFAPLNRALSRPTGYARRPGHAACLTPFVRVSHGNVSCIYGWRAYAIATV